MGDLVQPGRLVRGRCPGAARRVARRNVACTASSASSCEPQPHPGRKGTASPRMLVQVRRRVRSGACRRFAHWLRVRPWSRVGRLVPGHPGAKPRPTTPQPAQRPREEPPGAEPARRGPRLDQRLARRFNGRLRPRMGTRASGGASASGRRLSESVSHFRVMHQFATRGRVRSRSAWAQSPDDRARRRRSAPRRTVTAGSATGADVARMAAGSPARAAPPAASRRSRSSGGSRTRQASLTFVRAAWSSTRSR